VLDVLHPVTGQRAVERRPPTVALELGRRREQLRTTGTTGIDALGRGGRVLAHERPLRARLAQHVVLGRAQLGAPLLLALVHGIRPVGALHAHRVTPDGSVGWHQSTRYAPLNWSRLARLPAWPLPQPPSRYPEARRGCARSASPARTG